MDAPLPTRRNAKLLRRRLSLPEGLLWRHLQGRKLQGLHFRRQHPIGPYILDFYCDTCRLCVEVDGQGHGAEDRAAYDARRDQWLLARSIRTLRLQARLVLSDMEAALGAIRHAAGKT